MFTYSRWIHVIAPFWCLFSVVLLALQDRIEKGIEERELALRRKKENLSEAMKKYYKKKQDKFDKVDFLGDMYKLMQEHLTEINKQIAENDANEKNPNINKMLKDKYSLQNKLIRGHSDGDLKDIHGGIYALLGNLRFNDGITLAEKLQQI